MVLGLEIFRDYFNKLKMNSKKEETSSIIKYFNRPIELENELNYLGIIYMIYIILNMIL